MIDYRKKYIADLVAEHGPVSATQAKNIAYFPPDKSYRVWADFKEVAGAVPFMVPSHSGKSKPYKEFGKLTFQLHGAQYTLHVYQSMDLLKTEQYKNYLFLPFKDLTNYVSTYGGGRYIDLKLEDIKNGKVLLDFNRAYNPYCAYSDGFSCPIPPDENRLLIEVPVGEKVFVQ
jgi:hypothetical protein